MAVWDAIRSMLSVHSASQLSPKTASQLMDAIISFSLNIPSISITSQLALKECAVIMGYLSPSM
jgi:hypothetical protein